MSFHTLIHAALHLLPPPPPPLSSSHAPSQKRQTPILDSAHVQGLIRIGVPWWRGTMWLARGACHCEACQRAFKEPRPRKRKQMAAGITPLTACTCSPHTPLPQLLFNQCPEKPSGGLWSGRMSQCWACLRSIRSQSPCWLLCNTFHSHTFTNRPTQFRFMARSAPLLLSTKHLTDNKQKNKERNDRRGRTTMATTNWRQHLRMG